MKYIGIFLTVIFLVVSSTVFSQQSNSGSNFGMGLNVGVQKPFCDKEHTAVAPAGEFMAKYFFSKKFSLTFGLGFGMLGDGYFDDSSFETNLITGDLRANIGLLDPGKINPFVTIGAGIFNFQYNPTASYAPGYAKLKDQGFSDNRFFDGSLIVGGGMEIMNSSRLGINLSADYRFTTSDDIDGGSYLGDSKDGYLNLRAGFIYYMGDRPTHPGPTDDDLLALQGVEYGEVEESEFADDSDNLAMFEAKLDKLEASESDFSMEQYVRLKSRVDELNRLIDDKERELDGLRASLDFKNQRISDLEGELQQPYSSSYVGSDQFSVEYEEALRTFYSRDYSSAIRIFSDLIQRFPSHKLASNCQYWIGESYFGMSDFSRASDAFQNVFDYHLSYKKDDATLMLGRCYQKMQDTDTARRYFQEVIDVYPSSEDVGKAKEGLDRIG